MSESTFDDNSFRDYYKAENSDDEENNNDLENQLYADIYYPSNNEIELGADVLSNAVPLSSCIVSESMNRQKNIQSSLNNKVISEFEVTKEQEEPTAAEVIQTNKKKLADERSNTAEIYKNKKSSPKKQKSPKQSKNKHRKNLQDENIVLADESSIDTKYNVLHKNMKQEIELSNMQVQTLEDSDSESILEVPIPPKPKPLLIDLQDSDDENAGSSIDEDDLLEGRLHGKNVPKNNSRILKSKASSSPDVEIIEELSDHQDPAAKSNTAKSKSSRNRSAARRKKVLAKINENITHVHEVNAHDIVLNCTLISKGATSINEIRQLSKNAEQNRIETSVEGTSSKRKRDTSRSNDDTCTSQESTSREKGVETEDQMQQVWQNIDNNETNNPCTTLIHHLKNAVNTLEDTLLEVSCGIDDNLAMSHKTHSEEDGGDKEDEGNKESGGSRKDGKREESEEASSKSPARKRQCIVQQDDQLNVAPTPRSSDKTTKKSASFWNNYFFKPLPEALKKFYNDSRGQENFDVREIQHNMSKNPKKWMILDEDLMPSPAFKRGRYWSGLRCTYCQRDGHLRKDCLEPPKIQCCHMCGQQGHITWRCPQQVCLTCGKKQNTYRKSCEHCRTLYCIMCCSVGHKKEHCPDLWRRYHSITREIGRAPRNPGNVMKPESQLHCCNCSKRGHESSTCTEYRWSTHFPTPAFVTNYTEGPVYELQSPSERISMNIKTPNVPLFKGRSDSMNQPIHENMPAARAETEMAPPPPPPPPPPPLPPPPPPNIINASLSSATAEIVCEKTYAQSTQVYVMTISEVNMLKFANVIYNCGNLKKSRNSHLTRVLVSNISRYEKLSSEGKQFLQSKFTNGTIFPIFLKKLRKIVEFELTIGLLAGRYDVMVQLIAPKDSVYQLFYLLLYWVNLPLSEKQHGLDVNLPVQTGQMFYFLKNLSPKLFKEIKEPMKLYNTMNNLKQKLQKQQNMPKNKEYYHNQTTLWNMQTELLAFINTHPVPNIHVRKILSYIDKLKNRQTRNDQLDAVTFFDILISYNNIYTPHTPVNLRNLLKTIMDQTEKRIQKPAQEQQLPPSVDVNFSTQFATPSSCTPQGTDIVVNPFMIPNVQNVPHGTLNFIERVNDICQPGTSNVVGNYMQYPQNVLQPYVQPISVQPENSYRQNGQWTIDNVNINANLPVNEPDVNAISANNGMGQKRLVSPTKKLVNTGQRYFNDFVLGKNKQTKNKQTKNNQTKNNKILEHNAIKVANEARAFQLSYMVKAAEDLLRKLNDKTLKKKDLTKIRRMIQLENKHQKAIKNLFIT